MKRLFNEEERKRILTYAIAGIIIVIAFFIITNIPAIFKFIKRFFEIISPFIWGIVFAILLLPLDRRFEELLPKDMKVGRKRGIAAILTILVFLLVVALIVIIVIPELISSAATFTANISSITSNTNSIQDFLKDTLHLDDNAIAIVNNYSSQVVQTVISFMNNAIPSVISAVSNTVSLVANFFMGIIIAVYILIGREKIVNTISDFLKGILPEKHYDSFKAILSLSIEKFSQFFIGKIIDSVIIGIICFIMMIILRLEYSVLISFVIGVTNIIPFFGPFIGAIPSAIILLLVNPMHALIFLIMVLILQQIDGNIIGPRILGESVGLSGIWIMFAILVGGGYFGFVGMLFGVPIFSIIYFLIKYYFENKNTKEIKE